MAAGREGGDKKGLHPLAKVGIGCGILVILGVVAVVVAGVMGVKFFQTQVEEYEKEAAAEQEKWRAESGITTGGLEELSEWFDLPDGVTGLQSVIHAEQENRMAGQVSAESHLQPIALGRAFASELEEAGFRQVNRTETQDEVIYVFEKATRGRQVTIMITAVSGASSIEINYVEE